MNATDDRFAIETTAYLRTLIGQKLLRYKCDPFLFSSAVYGIVGIITENTSCAFTNRVQARDYYGKKEDVAIFRLEKMPEEKIVSMTEGETMLEIPMGERIEEVRIVNEHQKLFKNEVQTYDVQLTRGVIFMMEGGLELSLEKNIWFSEMITVERGYKLIERYSPAEEFAEDWEDEYRGECTRNIVVLR